MLRQKSYWCYTGMIEGKCYHMFFPEKPLWQKGTDQDLCKSNSDTCQSLVDLTHDKQGERRLMLEENTELETRREQQPIELQVKYCIFTVTSNCHPALREELSYMNFKIGARRGEGNSPKTYRENDREQAHILVWLRRPAISGHIHLKVRGPCRGKLLISHSCPEEKIWLGS